MAHTEAVQAFHHRSSDQVGEAWREERQGPKGGILPTSDFTAISG